MRLAFYFGCLVCCLAGSTLAEEVSIKDRVITGNVNLGSTSKTAKTGIKDKGLADVVKSADVHAIVIQKRMVKEADGTEAPHFGILYVKGRSTEFKHKAISQHDYEWLIEEANRLGE